MVSALVLRGHLVHFVVFGLPVAWLVGAVGLQEIRGRREERAAAGAGPTPVPRTMSSAERLDGRSAGLRMAACGLLAAAAVHAFVIPEHFREFVLYGVFFTALSAAQVVVAAIVTFRPDRRTVRWVAIGSAWVVVLWLVSRTSGVPIGPEPWQPEAFTRLDIAATCAELLTLAGCLLQLWSLSDRRRAPAHSLRGLAR